MCDPVMAVGGLAAYANRNKLKSGFQKGLGWFDRNVTDRLKIGGSAQATTPGTEE